MNEVGLAFKNPLLNSQNVETQDKDKGRFSLSTKSLEPEPGDMVKNPATVFDNAEAMAARYHERLNAEQKAREEVMSLLPL